MTTQELQTRYDELYSIMAQSKDVRDMHISAMRFLVCSRKQPKCTPI